MIQIFEPRKYESAKDRSSVEFQLKNDSLACETLRRFILKIGALCDITKSNFFLYFNWLRLKLCVKYNWK